MTKRSPMTWESPPWFMLMRSTSRPINHRAKFRTYALLTAPPGTKATYISWRTRINRLTYRGTRRKSGIPSIVLLLTLAPCLTRPTYSVLAFRMTCRNFCRQIARTVVRRRFYRRKLLTLTSLRRAPWDTRPRATIWINYTRTRTPRKL